MESCCCNQDIILIPFPPHRYIKPQEIPQLTGGTVVIGLRREIPERFWNYLEILLVGGKGGQMALKPSGIKRGKKICIKVPPGMESRDYDVRVVGLIIIVCEVFFEVVRVGGIMTFLGW